MSCVYEGMLVDIDTGLKIESRYFVACTQSKEARNMIRSLFFSIGDANKLANRPKNVPTQSYTKVGILGAGMMGAGIAYAARSEERRVGKEGVSKGRARGWPYP